MKYARTVFPALTLGFISLSLLQTPTFADPATPTDPLQPTQTSETSPAPVEETSKPYALNAETEALQLTDDIAVAKKQAKAHPDDPEAHFLYAAALSRSPYLEQAFKEIKKVKNILKERQDFEFIDRTLVDYEQLGQENPNNPVVLYRLAMAYYFKAYTVEKYPHHYKNTPTEAPKAFYDKAETIIRKLIAINPNDTWARNYLGFVVSESGKDLTKAIPIWEESLKIEQENNPGAYLLLSQAYLQKGDLQNAMVYGAKGLEIKQRMGMTIPK